ncbi:MAG TPA: hypothetical protein VFM70_03785 [Salinimicrobium sp.]|nr:hypothetical protein [Salinimicrobium sp.]
MNYLELNKHFTDGIKQFRTNHDIISSLENQTKLYNGHRSLFYECYKNELFELHIENYILKLDKEMEKHLGFTHNIKYKKKYLVKQLKNIRNHYLKNWFSHCFSVENFHNEMFDIKTTDRIFESLFSRNKKNFESNFRREKLKKFSDIATGEYIPLADCLNILMQNKFYKAKLRELEEFSVSEKSSTAIPSNEYPFLFKTKWTYLLFTETIKEYQKTNYLITKTLLSKYYELFCDEEYFLKKTIPQDYFRFLKSKYNMDMLRIESFTSSNRGENEKLNNLTKIIKQIHSIESLL